jgi:hypothetical protein
MRNFLIYRSHSFRQQQPDADDDCKFCCGSTVYGLPICSDCYRELGTGE